MTAPLTGLTAQLVKRPGSVGMEKLRLVKPTVVRKLTGTQTLWPICTGSEPMLTSKHGPTITVKVRALLAGGLLLSIAQTVIRLVVLPSPKAGVQ